MLNQCASDERHFFVYSFLKKLSKVLILLMLIAPAWADGGHGGSFQEMPLNFCHFGYPGYEVKCYFLVGSAGHAEWEIRGHGYDRNRGRRTVGSIIGWSHADTGPEAGWTIARISRIDPPPGSTVSFASSSGSVSEGGGTRNVQVNLSPAPQSNITVTYTVDGSATRNTDYTVGGSVSVPSGATSVNIPVVITDDNANENNETVLLTLNSGTGYTVGSPNSHTLTIQDNDPDGDDTDNTNTNTDDTDNTNTNTDDTDVTFVIPEVFFASSSASVNEHVGTHNVHINLSPAPQSVITVSYTLDGTAIRGTDYTISGFVSAPSGATSVNIPVTITNDNATENDEKVVLMLTISSNYTLGNIERHTLTIIDDDAQPVLSIADTRANEGDTAVFPVQLSSPSGKDISVDWEISGGTATGDTDYTATSGTLHIPAGETQGTIEVATV